MIVLQQSEMAEAFPVQSASSGGSPGGNILVLA